MKKTICVILSLLIVLCLCSCSKQTGVTKTGFYFDTVISISVYDGECDAAAEYAIELCRYYDALFDKNNPVSDIYAINHSGGKPVEVSEETAELIALGIEYGTLSGGIFDITCGAVTAQWDFSSDQPQLPDKTKLDAALLTVDYTQIALSDRTVTIPDGCMIELGGIAKGYIADKLCSALDHFGVTKAIISLGGNVYAKGSSQSDEPWRIGVQSPFDQAEYSCIVKLVDCSAVTSGTYQRSFELGGTLYHHILSTETGMPITTDLASATIISSSSASCDALSTICMLLGYEEARALIDSLDNTEAVFVLADGTVHITDGIIIA